ncbi:hypothetical protein HMPREF0185_02219 [Brevundimonas diminuta 470-4]|nr:hypothetical protein HMPREF0185_02219 [Brevundimonas diminuta 470-4]
MRTRQDACAAQMPVVGRRLFGNPQMNPEDRSLSSTSSTL